jgi:hypothetical protein
MTRTIIWTNDNIGTTDTPPTIHALASAIVAHTVAIAVGNTCAHQTIVTLPSVGAVARAIAAVAMAVAVSRASEQTAIKARESDCFCFSKFNFNQVFLHIGPS